MKKLVATLMLSLLLLGCAVGNKGLAAEKPLVVVSFYPLEYIVRVLAGDQLDLVNLSSGFDVHEYNLKPSDLVAISNASLFISSGTVLEPWVNSLSIDNSSRQMQLAEALDFKLATADSHHHTEHEEHDEHDEDDADELVIDPHFWLDPNYMLQAAEAIAHQLQELGVMGVEDSLPMLKDRLDKLDTAFNVGLSDCKSRKLVVSHNAYSYLADRYNLELIAVSGINSSDSPSTSRLVELTELVREYAISTIFLESTQAAKWAKTIAQETGVQTLELETVSYLRDKDSDYFDLQQANLENLKSGLECN